jgi:hypothetical protein
MNEQGQVQSNDALQMQQWMENGAFEALELGYLDTLTLQILDGHPNDPTSHLLETYTFRITNQNSSSTTNNNKQQSIMMELKSTNNQQRTTTSTTPSPTSREEIHAAVQKMIKTLVILTSSLQELPRDRYLSMLLGFNDTAPPSYQPNHFCSTTSPEVSNAVKFTLEPLIIPLGEVKTGFHVMDLEFSHVETNEQTYNNHNNINVSMSSNAVNDDQNVITTSSAMTMMEDQPTQKVSDDKDGGYDSDSTAVQWAAKKSELLEQISKIANGVSNPAMAEFEVRKSNLAKNLDPCVLEELLGSLNLSSNTVAAPPKKPGGKPKLGQQKQSPLGNSNTTTTTTTTNGNAKPLLKLSRVKRPIHQLLNENESTTSTRNVKRIASASSVHSIRKHDDGQFGGYNTSKMMTIDDDDDVFEPSTTATTTIKKNNHYDGKNVSVGAGTISNKRSQITTYKKKR